MDRQTIPHSKYNRKADLQKRDFGHQSKWACKRRVENKSFRAIYLQEFTFNISELQYPENFDADRV
jgi:hypothetical protein